MKQTKMLRTIGIALSLALLVLLIPATPALAQDLAIDPDECEIGEEFELYGSGFIANYDYDAYLSDERASVGDDIDDDVINYQLLGWLTVDVDGTFGGEYFDVPSKLEDGDEEIKVLGGSYYVYLTYENDERIRARVSLTVLAVGEISIDPDEGTVGTAVEITGEGFGDEEDITVEYDDDAISIESGDDATDNDGDFELTVLIPESTSGEHIIKVIGEDSDVEVEAEFTVEPEITISPASGAAGSTITVSGTGFGDRVDFIVLFDNDEVLDKSTDRDGSFEVSFAAPSKAAGSYDIEVEDEDNNSDKVDFTIGAAALNINPANGFVGIEVTVSGSGFQANKAVPVKFDNDTVTTATTNTNGEFTATFKVPVRAAGTYKVTASDGINTLESDFSISTSASINPETSASSPGHIGTELTVSGVGFTPDRTATVTYDGKEVTTTPVKPDGTFSATFKVPVSKGGEYTITATDVINSKSFTFVMESTAPPIPRPLKPEMGIKAEALTYFDWEDVTDPSGVTYTLQIATDESFSRSSIVLEKTGLTKSEYTITEEEKLESVGEDEPYYWHVHAIDGASNESQWTGTGEFNVGFNLALGMSQTLIYVLIGAGAVVLIILAFWLGRKTAYY